ncbi:MAG TPA: hypothetical protein VFP63_07780 [Dehalococcoidia bacterium]|nr:hypothetical protein [Dehalococcoidia bacterium]
MATPAVRPGLITAFKFASHAVTLLVILQAVLAGMFISGEQTDAKDQHEVMANVIFVAVAVQLVLAFLVRGWGQFRLLYWVGLLLVLSVAQIGLGYASREDTLPEAIHIPLGVFLFGLALVISVLAVMEDRPRGTAA